jgi:hypothetical protein
MIDERTLAQMNGEYLIPPDAGPAWREARAAGIDMSLIEHSLEQSPAERLATHQQVLDFVLEVQQERDCNATR